ncbi:MAG: hypothetical protein DBX52_00180 [Clostridiales bacterium]|nr:MAG: hypothetical protein DBX52_00180 [Clostridiales bacterium]
MKKLRLSPLLFLLVFSYVLIEGSFDPLLILLFSLIHEMGHILMIRFFGGGINGFSGGGQGFGLQVNGLSYRQEFWVALAGPLTSILLTLFFGVLALWRRTEHLWFCCFANFALAAMNLLPIVPLDGGRILSAALALRCEPQRQQAVVNIVGLCCLLPLLGAAFWQFLSSGYNISLLFVCFYLIGLIKENGYDL